MFRRFAYRLALAMGRVDVDRMCEELTADEMMGWATYYAVEPFGEERADLRVGVLSSLVANVFGGKTKPRDFILTADERPRQSREEVNQKMEVVRRHLFAVQGKKWQP